MSHAEANWRRAIVNQKSLIANIANHRYCPNLTRNAGFQPADSRQDGGATFKLGQHQITNL